MVLGVYYTTKLQGVYNVALWSIIPPQLSIEGSFIWEMNFEYITASTCLKYLLSKLYLCI